MFKNLGNKMEKMKESINKPRRINEQTYRDNNKITEIKNTLGGINSRISEAE